VIWKTLSDIITYKRNDGPSEDDFTPFMTCRWLSMKSKTDATVVNQTSNRMWKGFTDNNRFYNFIKTITPQGRNNKIAYISKAKKAKGDKRIEAIELIAGAKEISIREVKNLVDDGLLNVDDLVSNLKK